MLSMIVAFMGLQFWCKQQLVTKITHSCILVFEDNTSKCREFFDKEQENNLSHLLKNWKSLKSNISVGSWLSSYNIILPQVTVR